MTNDSASSFLGRHWALVRVALFALIIASFAKSLFDFTHVIKIATIQPSSVSDIAGAPHLPDIQAIARLGWFGIVPESPPPTPSNAPSQFELRGISASGQAQLVGAFIAEQGKPESYYRVGDALPNGGKLDAVFSDHVTIRSGQALTTLGFTTANVANSPTTTGQPPVVYNISPAK